MASIESAKRVKPPLDDWQIIWGVPNQFAGIPGAEIVDGFANFSRTKTGYEFSAIDPIYGRLYRFSIYDLKKRNGEVVQAAICELSNGVYATALRDERKPI